MADTYLTLSAGLERSAGSGGTANIVAGNATVAADVATLVADGASPTQAHVTTLNTDWGTLLTSWTKFSALIPSAAVLVNIDTTQVPTVSVLRMFFNTLLKQAAEAGLNP